MNTNPLAASELLGRWAIPYTIYFSVFTASASLPKQGMKITIFDNTQCQNLWVWSIYTIYSINILEHSFPFFKQPKALCIRILLKQACKPRSYANSKLRLINCLTWVKCRAECDIRIDFDTNEYPNIFVSRKLHERISEYIRIKILIRTNIRINIWIENIRIYSSLSGLDQHQFRAFTI